MTCQPFEVLEHVHFYCRALKSTLRSSRSVWGSVWMWLPSTIRILRFASSWIWLAMFYRMFMASWHTCKWGHVTYGCDIWLWLRFNLASLCMETRLPGRPVSWLLARLSTLSFSPWGNCSRKTVPLSSGGAQSQEEVSPTHSPICCAPQGSSDFLG